ncbi:MAG: hypothetical protein EON60_00315 [Alphaproteobacteria bacterium]|nr:MAG: hypothetical protein EON60_00315 [Alphaproteobacteria bacterium]
MKRTDTPLQPDTATSNQSGDDTSVHTNATSVNGVSLSPSVQKHIGNLLKVSFQDLLTDPVPDRFASLLNQLEQAEKKGK